MKHILTFLSILVWLLIVSAIAVAQNPEAQDGGAENSSGLSQVGISLARLLPNGVSDEDEILPLWGVRYSLPLNSRGNFIDFGGVMGSGSGVDWQGLSTGVSMHVPIETLLGHAGVGVDMTRYSTSTDSKQNVLGFHFIGGVMSRVGGNLLLRFDMKLASKPGTYLLFGLGFVFELGGGGSGGASDK